MLAQVGPNWPQVGSKLAPSWPQTGPSWHKVGPSLCQVRPSWPQNDPSWCQVGPTWPQVGPRLPQVRSKLAPNCFNMVPSWFNLTPSRPQDCMKSDFLNHTQKQMENNDFPCFLCLVWDQDGAHQHQVGTNLGELSFKSLQVGPKLV